MKSLSWSANTDVQAGLALYWWQRLITFGSGRIRVNNEEGKIGLHFKLISKTTQMLKWDHTLLCNKPVLMQYEKIMVRTKDLWFVRQKH